jgi:hypothetical protein
MCSPPELQFEVGDFIIFSGLEHCLVEVAETIVSFHVHTYIVPFGQTDMFMLIDNEPSIFPISRMYLQDLYVK